MVWCLGWDWKKYIFLVCWVELVLGCSGQRCNKGSAGLLRWDIFAATKRRGGAGTLEGRGGKLARKPKMSTLYDILGGGHEWRRGEAAAAEKKLREPGGTIIDTGECSTYCVVAGNSWKRRGERFAGTPGRRPSQNLG